MFGRRPTQRNLRGNTGSQYNLLSFCSVIANMETILSNFQQKFALVRSFQHFAIKFLNQKRFLAYLKSASKSLLS